MSWLIDVSGCHPPCAHAPRPARGRFTVIHHVVELRGSRSFSLLNCRPIPTRGLSIPSPCDEMPLPGMNEFVAGSVI
jgi:hypothetical protein